MSDDLPEPDRAPGAPHPRETAQLFGQSHAEEDFLTAYNSGRLHHGWLITGPQGVGKATMAWRIARFLLATPPAEDGLFGAPPPPETLDIDPEHPVAHRMRALSEPGLFLLRRGPNDKGDKLAADIRVGEVRKLGGFFSLSAADGGRRVVIVDSADELNTQSANAILKMLEEPPARTTLLLISHSPARLLPTIRSRCRELRLAPLAPDAMAAALEQAHTEVPAQDAEALTALASGSVGAALRLINLDGVSLYKDLLGVLGSLPQLDRPRLLQLSDSCAGKGKEDRLELALSLTDQLVARLARTGVLGRPPEHAATPDEAKILHRLAPDAAAGRRWAQAAQEAGDRARHARAVNVDPAALMTDLFLQLQNAQ
ncbi:DNA polymerase III subunit delta' [Tropicibacter naphthalenivorans]|uniref:DNA polymerase III subunit tau n=1 Tax=Tropicibacter naphthalenivorans TaxID=441103 RepID=A0A0P1G390_9RHOB|nr:DNA polymerase III subunit delta' [Tropicibacter naphthalenivorans]CUH76256.1 DNA polymerase III subunit tau [Tropicibacter naphthalenivorans]SMC39129.1 DNA polymerase-3 subunit delta' [Tropicibacter naphthalenivorans]